MPTVPFDLNNINIVAVTQMGSKVWVTVSLVIPDNTTPDPNGSVYSRVCPSCHALDASTLSSSDEPTSGSFLLVQNGASEESGSAQAEIGTA